MITGIFVRWVWTDAPALFWTSYKELVSAIANYFSIRFLVTTLFDPWRHDQIDMSRLPLHLWFQAMTSNLASRFIGAIVRGVVILAGCVSLALVVLAGLALFLIWYLFPLLLLASMFYGVWLIVGGGHGI